MSLLFPMSWVTADANAMEVASTIHHFLTHRDTTLGKLFALDIARPDGSAPERLWLRPEWDEEVFTLVTGHEIVICRSQDDEVVNLLLPPPEAREFSPVIVVRRQG